jgi:carbonic anhydrase
MKSIKDSIANFQNEFVTQNRELLDELDKGQSPHTLFVTCSDSRVVPNLLMDSKPGELFVMRNIANIIPPHTETGGFEQTASVLEYAIKALKVKRVIICAHSRCGGCAALYNSEEELKELPIVYKWLNVSRNIPSIVEKEISEGVKEDKAILTEQYNLKLQLQNLLTYPYIETAVFNGELEVVGMHYDVGTGGVTQYNASTNSFESV